MVSSSIWIIEDDLSMQWTYSDILGDKYKLAFIPSLDELSKRQFRQHQPQLLILDLLFPDGRLHQVYSNYKQLLKSIPFFIVSGLDDEDAVRISFDWGAMDYITKPFGRSELQVKIENFLSRKNLKLAVDPVCRLDPLTMTAYNAKGHSIELTAKEYRILSILLETPSANVSRQKIYDTLWKNVSVSEKTIDVHLSNIRHKILELGLVVEASETAIRISTF